MKAAGHHLQICTSDRNRGTKNMEITTENRKNRPKNKENKVYVHVLTYFQRNVFAHVPINVFEVRRKKIYISFFVFYSAAPMNLQA